MRVLRLEVSVYYVYNYNPVLNLFSQGLGRGGNNWLVKVTVNSKKENYYDFYPNNVQEFEEFGLCTSLLSVTSSHFFPSPFPFLSHSSTLPLFPFLPHASLCRLLCSYPSPFPLPNPIFTQTSSLFQFRILLLRYLSLHNDSFLLLLLLSLPLFSSSVIPPF